MVIASLAKMIFIFALIVAFIYSQLGMLLLTLGYYVFVVHPRPEHSSLLAWLEDHSFDYEIFTLVLLMPILNLLID